jgi:hypothetical protein
MPGSMPDVLAVQIASLLRSSAAAEDVGVAWLEEEAGGVASLIGERRADIGLDWLAARRLRLPGGTEAMRIGHFEPGVWLPATHPAARRGAISLAGLARMNVIHGPHAAGTAVYDEWTAILRGANPGFAFARPPSRHSLAPALTLALSLASAGDEQAAVLTGPCAETGPGTVADPGAEVGPGIVASRQHRDGGHDMVRVRVDGSPLTASAVLMWRGDLPRALQQVLFSGTGR